MKVLLLIIISLSICACTSQRSTQENAVLTVDHLLNNMSEYNSKMVDVKGEIVADYHGLLMCDDSGIPCFGISLPEHVTPAPGFELEKDHMYEEYERLKVEIIHIRVNLQIENAKLFATLRGRFDTETYTLSGKETDIQDPLDIRVGVRFVLQRILNVEIKTGTATN